MHEFRFAAIRTEHRFFSFNTFLKNQNMLVAAAGYLGHGIMLSFAAVRLGIKSLVPDAVSDISKANLLLYNSVISKGRQ